MRPLLLLLPALLPALDVFDFADLRVGASIVGKRNDLTVDDGTTSQTAKDGWRRATRVNADWVAGTDLILIGVAYGLGVSVDKRTSDNLDYQSTIGRVQAGPYVDFTILQLELLPFAGVGSARIRQEASGGDHDTATSLEYGANLNLVAAISHLAVGATVGYLKTDSTATLDQGGTATDYEIRGGDYTAGVFVGYRF
jgi:hypothetical protein